MEIGNYKKQNGKNFYSLITIHLSLFKKYSTSLSAPGFEMLRQI